MKCKIHFSSIFKTVFKWKTEGTMTSHLIFQKGADCWEHQLFKIWNGCFVITILKRFYKNQECFLFMFDVLSKSMNAYSKEEEMYQEKTLPGKFGKHSFLTSSNLILDCSLFRLDNKLLQQSMILPEIFQYVPKTCEKNKVFPYIPNWMCSIILVV